jgi:hypothetical protein
MCVRKRTDAAPSMRHDGCMTTLLPIEYNDFLHAPIGDDSGGNPVTLLSALGRLDLDAWEEAAALARLPLESATHLLAAHLAQLPNGPDPVESVTIATRLVTLLHRKPAPRNPSPGAPPPPAAEATQSRRIKPAIYYIIALIFLIAWQWVAAIQTPQFPADSSISPATP